MTLVPFLEDNPEPDEDDRPPRHLRQPVPLHRLPAHRRRGDAGGRAAPRRRLACPGSPSSTSIRSAPRTGQQPATCQQPRRRPPTCWRISAPAGWRWTSTCARSRVASRVIEPRVLAFLPEPGRFERLRDEARQLAFDHLDPDRRPPLYGLLFGVKDVFRADGFATGGGSRLPPAELAGPEAEVVTRLKQLGALVAGKTVSTEFAYFAPGADPQPARPGAHPGRLLERLGGGRGGGPVPAGPGHPDDRLDQPPGGVLRRGRLQADLRHGLGQGAHPAGAVARPRRLVHPRRGPGGGGGDRIAAAARPGAGGRSRAARAGGAGGALSRARQRDRPAASGRDPRAARRGGLPDRRARGSRRHRRDRAAPPADRRRRSRRGARRVVRAPRGAIRGAHPRADRARPAGDRRRARRRADRPRPAARASSPR